MVMRADAPIVVEGAEHFVERNYREGGRFQWVRETLVNALEAEATKVEFGTEWQGVREHNVFRRTIADDGKGMTPEELLAFFRTYGGSGKAIGGLHDNFGIGAKSSLFPWNKAGVVIISWHPDFEDPSMIWVRKDAHSGQYGLRTWETDDGGGDNVVVAGPDDELGIDWADVKPEWIGDHGTVVVLLGDDLSQDTVLGDPNPGRAETGVPGVGVVNYLNRRVWDLGDKTVLVDEYRGEEKSTWPRSSATTVNSDLQLGRRRVRGAKHYIEYPPAVEKKKGLLKDSGTVPLSDGTQLDWYLWEGEGRDGIRGAAINGFLAARYQPSDNRTIPELFDVVDHASRFRGFGISESEVRKRVWLIARPPLAGPSSHGVYMSGDRNRLLIQGGPKAGDPLPWENWAAEFADNAPQAIIDAIARAREGRAETDLDSAWRDRLAERFGKRWRQLRLLADPKGDKSTQPEDASGAARKKPKKKRPRRKMETVGGETGTGGRTGNRTLGTNEEGTTRARETSQAVGLPEAQWLSDSDVFRPGIFAVWNPPSKANPSGLVQLNVDHPVLKEELVHWALQYPTHLEDEVVTIVKDVYAQMAAATVAHTEALKTHLERRELIDDFRSETALTTGLLGLIGADAIIGPRLGGALGRKKKTDTVSSQARSL